MFSNVNTINWSINKEIGLGWFRDSFEVNHHIGFGSPCKFQSESKKNIEILTVPNCRKTSFLKSACPYLLSFYMDW